MKTINRRTFLKSTAVTAAAFSLPACSWARVPGANDEIRVAVVGFGGRGKDHISELRGLANKNVRIVALCDVDKRILGTQIEQFGKRNEQVAGFTDIRKLLELKDLDAISVATPNHWHSLATIWAIQAGKDVYVEKPVCHNVWEGAKMVEAARKHKKIVQAGTQSRSSQAIKEAIEWVRAGNLGKINIARGLCYKPRTSIGKVSAPQPPPPEVDYDLWSGPAPMAPIRRKRFHYDWHWFWNYGNGDMGNQGIHQMDIARWFLGESELSPRVWSVGGRLGYDDDGETANTQIVFHDYSAAPLIFEVRGLPKDKSHQTDKGWNSGDMDRFPSDEKGKGGSVCVIVHCEGGYVFVPDYTSATAFDKEGKEVKHWKGSSSHFENFIGAMRSRKVSDLNADIEDGYISSALCHTGNISYQLGKHASPGEILEKIKADRDATSTFERMQHHLEANGVDLARTPVALGEFLKMDPRQRTFPGNHEANKLLTREYRKPFVVPEKV
ncbi:MAG TPA: Gfo/Idh/MocA family oxidoreductase [Candidatus Angelobacter sp.]|nr:Gfo/Idh/MocA family oxidoreductase [Candidatus Angelobacter sp.]